MEEIVRAEGRGLGQDNRGEVGRSRMHV